MLLNDPAYLAVLNQIKAKIAAARHRARMAVSKELVMLYWDLGRVLSEQNVWGNRFIENLARDIRLAYPGITGYSARNLRYMAKFATTYPDLEILQRVVADLPWGHNTLLLDRVKTPEEREWYARAALEAGWSRDVLAVQIDTDLYRRQVRAAKTTNYGVRLPPPQSDLAIQTIKDPYIFDFIDPEGIAKELDLERELVRDVANLLLELGTGFAFVGRQFHIVVEGRDFYLDLLFYHLKLRCYVVIELKIGEFKPEFAGKMSFYVSAVDDLLRGPADQPTIGLLLCQDKAGMVAQYALKDINKPIGVSEYRIVSQLPPDLADMLPSAQDIAARVTNGQDNGARTQNPG